MNQRSFELLQYSRVPRLYHLTTEAYVPIGIPFPIGVNMETTIYRRNVQRQEVRTWSSKQFNGMPRRENHFFWNHFQEQSNFNLRVVLKQTNYWVRLRLHVVAV
jgi:hypothetical protein